MVHTAARIGLSRRDLIKGSATVVAWTALAGRETGPAAAQAGTPAAGGNPFADLGLPELAVTVTDTGYEGVPAELTAGRYVLTVTNAITAPNEMLPDLLDFAGAGLLKVPAEFTADELVAMMAAPPALESGATDAEASPEGSGPPPWYYETTLGGGPFAKRGETDYAVVDLTAGDWILWSEDPTAPQLLAALRVTGELPAELPAPAGSKLVEMSDFAFVIPPLLPGRQTLEVVNVGVQPHFLGLGLVPEGTTIEDVLALFATLFGDPSATPPANLSADDLRIVVDSAAQSAGVTAWHSVELVAGTYAAVCFIIDPATGLPHTMLGMAQLVVVA